MEQKEIFEEAIDILNRLNEKYMITGGFAVSFWGEPRATHDLDIVIDVLPGSESVIAEEFNKIGFFADDEAMKKAVNKKSFFNILHVKSDFKVDCWMVKEDVYNKERFSRRIKKKLFDRDVFLITPEDLILTKLKWFKDSDSSRHFMDAMGIFKIQKDILDENYIIKWAKFLELGDLWNELKNKIINE